MDFEFNFIARDADRPDDGGRPVPLCLCAVELRTGQRFTLWRDEFGKSPPFPINDRTLFVAFVASAEMSCFRVLNWPIPKNILDLSPEFRAHVSGRYAPEGRGLLGALSYMGLAGRTSVVEKDAWRDRILEGPPFSSEERRNIEGYCMCVVEATIALLFAKWPHVRDKLPYALIRGSYTGEAQSAIEYNGIPVDRPLFNTMTERWDVIKDDTIATLD